MQEHIDTTRRHIGELQSMARQTEDAERKILKHAEEQLAEVMKKLPAAKGASMTGDSSDYLDLIYERGRLHQVIAQARHVLSND